MKRMRIRVINPVITKEFEPLTLKEFKALARPDVQIEVVSLSKGPASIESRYDEDLAKPGILEQVKKAEEDGVDAVIINCFGEPGLHSAREIVSIPVIGPFQASMLLASSLGQTISIVTVLKSVVPLIEEKARMLGVKSRIASVRAIEVPVLELEKERAKVQSALLNESKKATMEDKADVIVLGCTGLVGMAKELQNSLKKEGFDVPVVDPALASLKLAEILVDLGISHSKLAYPIPPEKKRL